MWGGRGGCGACACACACGAGVGWVGGGGVVFRRSKSAPHRHYQPQLRLYKQNSKVQTSNPSSSPTPLDTPARPADLFIIPVHFC